VLEAFEEIPQQWMMSKSCILYRLNMFSLTETGIPHTHPWNLWKWKETVTDCTFIMTLFSLYI